MLSEIAVVEETVEGLSFEAFTQNPQAERAVLYSLAVIGEAVASAITDLEAADPTMPWSQIRGMRNAVIHEYFRVDLAVIWETVRADLPVLKAALERILSNFSA
ncbi:HepT-like ribonuclease domain-containing protein [Oscillatoria salina]|uniref:HepT-like ribonuclease domain-containing protein n=1 Tax=Oscillatoria salina TaxID=331517 RepID=UPI001CC8FBDA|nr:HepT-like ribonuclease domain-containing protein [Oscillatoria salina]